MDPSVLRSVLERSPDLVMLSEFKTGRVLYLNPAGVRLVGLADLADACSRCTADFVTEAGAAFNAELEAAVATSGDWSGFSEINHFGTGEAIPVTISVFVLHRTEEGPAVIVTTARDYRDSRRQERRLQQALEAAAYRAREQQSLAALSQLAVSADLDTVLSAATAAASAMVGMECSSIARYDANADTLAVVAYSGQPPRPQSLPCGAGSQAGYAWSTGSVVVSRNRASETRFATTGMAARGLKSGVSMPIGESLAWGVLTAHSSKVREYSARDLAFLRSVSSVVSAAIRRIELETRLRHQSLHDPLTGLPNRVLAFQRIEEALDRAREFGTRFALLLIDLDDFKTINDSLGHTAGDAALAGLAQRLAAVVRPSDTVARLGCDEFVVVCVDIDNSEAAIEIVRRINTAITDGHKGNSAAFSASIGVALSDTSSTPDDLIRRADQAMYNAKALGPGQYSVYEHA
ncbi:diguanylate cyclase [Antrihabitans sp. YC2-6]|nr:diguanylate cyclase [Antrihabitans sp. YC2-6]